MIAKYRIYFEEGGCAIFDGSSRWEAAAKCMAKHPNKTIIKVEEV